MSSIILVLEKTNKQTNSRCGVEIRQTANLFFSDKKQICCWIWSVISLEFVWHPAPPSTLFSLLVCNQTPLQSSLEISAFSSLFVWAIFFTTCLVVWDLFFRFPWDLEWSFSLEGLSLVLSFQKSSSASVLTAFVWFPPLSCRQRWCLRVLISRNYWCWRWGRTRLCSQGTPRFHAMGGSP